jgi:hypothetical protein
MRTASRTIAVVVLGLGLAAAGGCGSKSEPPNGPGPDQPGGEPGTARPNGDAKTPAPINATYQTDPARHAIPTGAVSGILGGEAVTAEVKLEGHTLVLRKPTAAASKESWQVWIDLPPESQRGEEYRLVVPPDKRMAGSVLVEFPRPILLKQWELFSFRGWEPIDRFMWPEGYSLTLELGKREKGRIAGKIYLALPEVECKEPAQARSYLAGSFEVDCPRKPTDPPTAEDVPLVNGSVKLRGAPATATLRVGYGGSAPTQTTLPTGGTEIQVGGMTDADRWTQTSIDPPRVTSLIAGDGKDIPARYEHSKLTPGRYLVFAQLKDGPAAWKWVNVNERSTIAVDLTIDATQVGGVEVTVPLGVLGKVQLAPAEEPGQPAMSPESFLTISLQMNLEADLVANKALFKNLAPGRYDVRAGGRSRLVEIVAGKTAELDLDAPPPLELKK